jgi:CheY-like chemotaxis protein
MSSHILVIDDDIEFRNYISILLSKNGYYVKSTGNGDMALNIIKSVIPNLIITDLIMPDMDGLEIIKIIKSQYPKIKIMAISGGGRIEPDMYLDLASKFKADAILKKPFKKDVILEKIEELLQEDD